MALPAFLRWDDDGTQEMRFDVVKDETVELTSELTEHAVEKGAKVSDHKRDNPNVVSLEVFCTNTPLVRQDDRLTLQTLDVDVAQYRAPLLSISTSGGTVLQALPTPTRLLNAGIAAVKDAFSVPDTIQTYQMTEDAIRYKEQLDQLVKLRDDVTLITVITAAREYSNMVLLRISPHKSPEDGDGYGFSLEFKSIRIVTTALVDAPVIAVPKAKPDIAKGAQKGGEGAGKANVSLAKKGTNATGLTKAGSGRSSPLPAP